jgi:hypothetical protein
LQIVYELFLSPSACTKGSHSVTVRAADSDPTTLRRPPPAGPTALLTSRWAHGKDMGIVTSIWVYTHDTKQPEVWDQLELDISYWLCQQPSAQTPCQLELEQRPFTVTMPAARDATDPWGIKAGGAGQWRWRTMVRATSSTSPPPPRSHHIWHHIIQWHHNYVISHNGDIRQNYMKSHMLSCVIWFYPFFGSCDIVKIAWCHMVYHGKITISHDPKNG